MKEEIERGFLAELPDLSVLRAAGRDARDFLARQLTSEVRDLPVGQSQLSAWCTAKGRVIAVGRLFCRADDFLLLIPRDLSGEVLTRLRRYVLRSAVELSEAEAVVVGCAGPRAGDCLRAGLGSLPERPDALVEHAGCTVVAIAGPGPHRPDPRYLVPRYLVLGDPGSVRAVRDGALAALARAPAAAWRALEILSATPVIHRATSEAYLPQMLNLEVLGGLSFQKGCYPGQEIIARLKYRGEVKRRMFLARAETDEVPEPGQPVFRAGAEGGEKAGEVLTAERCLGGVRLLAVIDLAALENTLHLGEPGGPVLAIEPLPYALNPL